MRVVLSTLGKFHSFDLARQMHRLGAFEAIFTGYPSFKLGHERLPRERVRTFPWLHAPYMRLGTHIHRVQRCWEWQDRLWFDRYVSRRTPACDVFCALSGSGLQSGRAARARGARYICDRGSSHIRYQDRLLREEYELQQVPFEGIDPRIVEREESEYDAADLITVPSSFALRSFVECGVPEAKLRLVPYGVDLHSFRTTARPEQGSFQVLFVGTVSVRKGLRYLIDAFNKLEHPRKRLTLIGPVSPELESSLDKLRTRIDIAILGAQPQNRLKHYMSASHALVLPSIEEGLALVQAQALACGCPVISSTNTGAADLFSDGVEGYIVPVRDSNAIANRLQMLADNSHLHATMSAAALRRVESIGGWIRYGDTMYRVCREAVSR